MTQFDVFNNPIVAARSAYPFVVALQSDITVNARDQIVAPMVRRNAISSIAGRLTPLVTMGGDELVALIPALTSLRSKDLGKPVGSLSSARTDILAAIDFLFAGV